MVNVPILAISGAICQPLWRERYIKESMSARGREGRHYFNGGNYNLSTSHAAVTDLRDSVFRYPPILGLSTRYPVILVPHDDTVARQLLYIITLL